MEKGTNKTNGIPGEIKKKINRKWVDARTLHEGFEYGGDFSWWIKRRIKRYGLVEGKDYEIFFKPRVNNPGVNPKEYLLSPETAEKLTVEHNSRIYKKSCQITSFTFGNRELNVFQHDGELWFLGVDVSSLLNLRRGCIANKRKEGQIVVFTDFDQKNTQRNIMSQHSAFNEWGLIWFICHSKGREAKAKEVSKWLINEALPKIRKDYDATPSMLDRFHKLIKSLHKQPKTLPLCDRPGFPINIPPKEAQGERA
jgi:prophage antirepressor-like protein/phage anti-repressor protein